MNERLSDNPENIEMIPEKYQSTLYTACGDVVQTPLKPDDNETDVVLPGYCPVHLDQD